MLVLAPASSVAARAWVTAGAGSVASPTLFGAHLAPLPPRSSLAALARLGSDNDSSDSRGGSQQPIASQGCPGLPGIFDSEVVADLPAEPVRCSATESARHCRRGAPTEAIGAADRSGSRTSLSTGPIGRDIRRAEADPAPISGRTGCRRASVRSRHATCCPNAAGASPRAPIADVSLFRGKTVRAWSRSPGRAVGTSIGTMARSKPGGEKIKAMRALLSKTSLGHGSSSAND